MEWVTALFSETRPGTVLIIDDSESTAAPLEIALSVLENVQVMVLSSAIDALKVLNDSQENVIAVVTDLHLPLMNGLELIVEIRASMRHREIPVIVVSGDSNSTTRGDAFQSGANAYFPKPYSPVHIRNELERLLHAS
jgi:PleD family two-component response regulator